MHLVLFVSVDTFAFRQVAGLRAPGRSSIRTLSRWTMADEFLSTIKGSRKILEWCALKEELFFGQLAGQLRTKEKGSELVQTTSLSRISRDAEKWIAEDLLSG